MINLEALLKKMSDKRVGVIGKSLFIHNMPTECELGVMLKGELAGARVNYELPGYQKSMFNVVARSKDYLKGKDNKRYEALIGRLGLRK